MSDESSSVTKGYKTTEFWLTALSMIVSLIIASDIVTESSGTEKIIGLIAAGLSSMGYSISRGIVKK